MKPSEVGLCVACFVKMLNKWLFLRQLLIDDLLVLFLEKAIKNTSSLDLEINNHIQTKLK